MDVTDGNRIPLGYQKISAATLASATALTVPSAEIGGRTQSARLALVRCEADSVSWRDDGVDPTADDGMPLESTDGPFPYTGSLSAVKFIVKSGSPVLHVAYYF